MTAKNSSLLPLTFFLFAIYLLSYRGGFHSVDEVSTLAVTESLVKFSTVNTNQIAWTQWTVEQAEAQGFFGSDGAVYSKKGLALSLAQAPLYALGLVLPGVGMVQAVSLLNAGLTAATAGLLYLLLGRLGFGGRVPAGVALLYGLATIAWVYAKYLFSEPLAGFLLLAAYYALVVYRQDGGWSWAGLAGLAAGMTVLARANNLLLLGLFGVYLLGAGWRRRDWPAGLAFLAGAAVAGALLLGYNWARSGNPFQTGYDLALFSANPLLGIYKLLFSPLRGLFIYSPILLLVVPGWFDLRRRVPAEAWLSLGLVGVTLGLFSVWSSGEGLSWGSRFLVPVVPLLMPAVAPLVARAETSLRWAGGLLVLSLISAGGQLLGVVINPWVYLGELQSQFGGEFFLEKTAALYDFATTQFAGQLRHAQVAHSDLAWWQVWGVEWPALLVSLGLVAGWAGLWWLGTSWRGLRPAAIGLTLLATWFILSRYYVTDRQFGPADYPYVQVMAEVATQYRAGDAVITVAESDYHVLMNRFKPAVPWLGLARSVEPLHATAYPLLAGVLPAEPGRVWLVTRGVQPADPTNRVEAWLAVHAYKASDVWRDDVRLVSYAAGNAGLTTTTHITLGGTVELLAYRRPAEVVAGEIVPVGLLWQATAPITANYTVFGQLLAGDGRLVAQYDGQPQGGYAPTAGWSVGRSVFDPFGLVVPAETPAGEYRLIVGLYDPRTGRRLPASAGAEVIELGMVGVRSR